MKFRPLRDAYGKVIAPARIWLYPDEENALCCPASSAVCLPVKGDLLTKAMVQDRIEFVDARGAHRLLQLVCQVGTGFWAESSQTSYLVPGLELQLLRVPTSGHPKRVDKPGKVGGLPQEPEKIRLQRGQSDPDA